ncbi:MAG TPA: hypothetical protein VLZ29_10220 [Sulfurimonas sp.]|nr:hypothetical protein [Sulfurimonas sp.]HUH43485.1 hypothetical protein [Sulfurimonas sp.]
MKLYKSSHYLGDVELVFYTTKEFDIITLKNGYLHVIRAENLPSKS